MESTATRAPLTGVERQLGPEEVIVSKTDPFGRITYANDTFIRIAGYTEEELLGAPHSLVRHPAMPRSVFALLWQRLSRGQDIFAVVVNRSRNGDHYWVHAHVTPSMSADGTILGHHSFRRRVDPAVVAAVEPIYRQLVELERRATGRAAEVRAGLAALEAHFGNLDDAYDRWSWGVAP